MLSIVLRRSASVASRRTVTAFAAVENLLHNHSYEYASSASPSPLLGNGTVSGEIAPFQSSRSFHVKSGQLNFRASLASEAEFAVDGYASTSYDDDKVDGSSKGDDGLDISKLGIAPEIISALSKKGIKKLFPIQRAVLEPAMQGRDMIGRAKTGTGKTLAFGIPILDKIIKFNTKHGRGKYPLALVLAPTRELGRQVAKEFTESAPNLDTICVYGGTPIQQQMRNLDYGVDVVVGTPGRIIDLIKRGALNLNEVQFLVIDEADQMLAVGFEEDVEMILQKCPQNRQSLMFSATMPSWIRNLTRKYLKDPLTIDLVGDSNQKLAEGISLYSILSSAYSKASVIGPLITEHAKGGKCIVFTQTKRDADRLAYAMGRNFKCEALHGDIAQTRRERTLAGFRDGAFNILIATDVASRGLDIPNVDLVIHYELPNSSEIFVHRSGRTGRAGNKGTAIAIYTDNQVREVKLIERDVGCKFTELPKITVEGGTDDFLDDMGGGGGRFGSYGGGSRDRRFGDTGYGRSGGQGGSSGFGRSGGYGNSGFGRTGGYGNSSSGGGRYGNFGGSGSRTSGSFGDFGSSGGSGSGSRTSGGFGDFGSSGGSGSGSRTSGGFGDFGSSRSGSRSSGGFGDFGWGSTGGSRSSR